MEPYYLTQPQINTIMSLVPSSSVTWHVRVHSSTNKMASSKDSSSLACSDSDSVCTGKRSPLPSIKEEKRSLLKRTADLCRRQKNKISTKEADARGEKPTKGPWDAPMYQFLSPSWEYRH